MKFFCPQCRAERIIDRFEEFRTKRNRRMAKATCPVCGLELYKDLEESFPKPPSS